MELIHCIYASSATSTMSERDLQVLLENARRRNGSLAITGMLLFIDDSYFQVLEGIPESVAFIYSEITKDRRHRRITEIIREPIPHRSFTRWSMGFESISRHEAQCMAGQNDFFSLGSCLQDIEPGRARKLLSAFANGRWRAAQTGAHRVHPHVA